MARSPLPCHFYNSPSGCRRGDCKFLHNNRNIDRGETIKSPRPSLSASPTPRSPPNPQRSGSPSPMPPRGVCRFYWDDGRCKREFDCRFEHTQTRSATNVPSPRLTVTNQAAEDLIAPFLTEKGLAKINSTGTDGFFAQVTSTSLSPTEAHRHLKRFLDDRFRFNTTFQVYAFLIPLTSANAVNRLWVGHALIICTVYSTVYSRLKRKARYANNLFMYSTLIHRHE
jgi:hypothetical protein